MGAVSWYCVRFAVVCASVCNRWKMMMLSVVLYRFTINKVLLEKLSIRAKTELTNMMKRARERVAKYNLNQMIFCVQYEHDEAVLDDEALQILKGWKRKAAGLKADQGFAGSRLDTRDMPKRYRHADGGILASNSVRDYQLPLATI